MYGFNNSGMQLIDAIRQRQPLRTISFLVTLNPRLVHAADHKGLLPIHYAVVLSTPDVVGYLVEAYPPSLAHKDVNGWMPLHRAAFESSSPDVIEYLADQYPPALHAKTTTEGWIPLHAAATNNPNADVVKCLIRKYPEGLDVTSSAGHVPLHCATGKAPAPIVQLLVQHRPQSVWIEDEEGDLPLHCAVETGNLGAVKCLIDAGPRALREVNVHGKCPLHIAAQHSPLEVVKLVTESHKDALRAKDHQGLLPMHIAAQYQPFPVVKYVATSFPEALGQRTTNDGRTPLHVAAQFAPVTVVQLIMDKHEPAVQMTDENGNVPLHVAAQYAKLPVIQAITNKYVDMLTTVNHKGQRPIDVARHERRHSSSSNEDDTEAIITWLENAMRRQSQANSSSGGGSSNRFSGDSATRVHEPDIQVAASAAAASANDDSDIRVYGGSNSSSHPSRDDDVDIRVWGSSNSSSESRPFPAESTAATTGTASPPTTQADTDPYQQDRERIRQVVEHNTSCEPVAVSSAYIQSIRTDTFLGDGFFGTVYKGKDAILGREFAIKSIHTEILRGGSPQDLEAAMKTFRTEQEALSRFRHPNIAALFAYTDPFSEGGAHGGYHLLYELAEKGSLDAFLADDLGRSRLGSFPRRVQVAIDVLTAIRFLHEGSTDVYSCFHRDIKSANIVIKRDFTAQLIDCGLAKFVNDRISTTGVKGTRGYVCPHYVKTGKYAAACDLYSFGIVLLELWTGQLQNHEDDQGDTFNFGEEYLFQERDVNLDADAAMDLKDPLPPYATRFTDVALRCINERIKNRPSGTAVLNELKDILVECAPEKFNSVDGPTTHQHSAAVPAEKCSTCRTMPVLSPHNMCTMCLFRQGIREEFSNLAVASQPSDAMAMDALSRQIEDLGRQLHPTLQGLTQRVEDVGHKIDATLPVMAQLDRRLNNQIPRTFLLLPADIKNGWKHPRSWMRSHIQNKYYLYFVCAVSQQAVSPPIKLKVAKDWVKKAAPVLATGLYLLQMSMKAGLNVSLDLDGAASDLFQVSSTHVAEMLQELTVLLDEDTGNRGLLDRLRAQQLSDDDVRELSGDAYELVIEKASEQNGWRSRMEPVRAPPSPKVFWVLASVARDPTHRLEVVTA